MSLSSEIVEDVKSSEALAAQLLLGATNRNYENWDVYYFYISTRPRIQNPSIFDIEAAFRNQLAHLINSDEPQSTALEVGIDFIPQPSSNPPSLVLLIQIRKNVLLDEIRVESALKIALQELYQPQNIDIQRLESSQAMFERYAHDKTEYYRIIGSRPV